MGPADSDTMGKRGASKEVPPEDPARTSITTVDKNEPEKPRQFSNCSSMTVTDDNDLEKDDAFGRVIMSRQQALLVFCCQWRPTL